MAATLAVVVDSLAENQLRLVFARQRNVCRAQLQQHDVDEQGDKPLGVRRQPGTLMTGVLMPASSRHFCTPMGAGGIRVRPSSRH